ncbi:hypothetical protein ColTof3_06149 [Colletotrichum tofieldiae]|nr:hypothetical protein ColTof3_06149 [Colletotrichum tofieldiae]GKT84936.1 hypothetical protein Ct61P_02786 [Colletotrichum tofieldiae]
MSADRIRRLPTALPPLRPQSTSTSLAAPYLDSTIPTRCGVADEPSEVYFLPNSHQPIPIITLASVSTGPRRLICPRLRGHLVASPPAVRRPAPESPRIGNVEKKV